MEMYLSILKTSVLGLLPLAVAFIGFAFLIKRRQLGQAWRASSKESMTNVGLWVVNSIVLAPLLILPLLLLKKVLPQPSGLVEFWSGVPFAVSVMAAFILLELVIYWRHRFEHLPALWRIHATHHADTSMTWFSVFRKHPLSKLLSLTVDSILVILLGLPLEAIAVAVIVTTWWGAFIHADVPWTLGKLGHFLISPAAHRLHHIRDERLMGSNYGNTLTLWDKMFGTYVDPSPYLNCETGIAEGTRGFVGELKRPFEARYSRKATQRESATS